MPDLQLILSYVGNATVEIYNSVGQLVYLAESTNLFHYVGDHNLKSGLYFVKVTDRSNNIYTQKLMVE